MKKWMAVLLCIVLCMGLALPVLGTNSEGVNFSATLSTEKLTVSESAQTVVLKLSGTPAFEADSFEYKVEYPEGWTAENIVSEDITFQGKDYNLTYAENVLMLFWDGNDEGTNEVISDLGSITFTVPANAAAKEYTFRVYDFNVMKDYGQKWEKDSELTATLTIGEVVLEKEATPAATFTATGPDTGKLIGLVDGGSYKLTGASPVSFTASGTSQELTGVSEGTLELVKKGDGKTTTDSDKQSISVSKAEAPSLAATQPTTIDGKGSIPTDATHEISTDGKTFTACTGETADLEPGTYYVRVKAKGTALASDSQKITITAFDPSKEATPTATFTATGPDTGTLSNLVSGMKYSLDGGESWTAVTETSAKLTGLSACTITVMMPGDGSTTTDSYEQTITVTKAKKPNLTAIQPDTIDGKGSIPTTEAHEFSTDGKKFEACTGEMAELELGTYYVRVKAKGTVLASDSQKITIVPSFNVSFDANDGTGTMEDVTVEAGDYTLPENSFTAPEGMESTHSWSIDGVEYSEGYVYKVEKDVTLVALWKDAEVEMETVATPKLPKEGTFSGTKTITITCATKGASIYYTTDGSTPSASSKLYTEEFTISATTTIKAIAIKDGMNDSEIATAKYTKSSGGGGGGGGSSDDGDTISVKIRLIGAEVAKKDVDLGKSSYLPAYVTWIPTTRYTLDEGATVYDLFVKATKRAGIRSVGADNNYVETIFAPDDLGGYELSEFTNGKRSGWMYTINGKHPGYGLKEQKLKDGDVVIWHYVNDYSYEVEDWVSEGQWQALGDGTYYNGWLKAPDEYGAKSTDKEDEEEENPARFENGIVILEAETDSGSASAKLDKDTVETGLEKSKDKKQLTVRIENEKASRIVLSIEADAVKSLADTANALRVETDKGTITLDSSDIAALAKKNSDVRIVVEDQSGGAVKLSVTVGGVTADVTMKVVLPAKAGQVLAFVNSDGSMKVIKKSVVVDGIAYAELPSGSTVKLIENAKSFKDVKNSDWFAEAVDFASSHELFKGVSDTEFAPKSNMTRAMLVTVLYRLEDEPKAGKASFGDVPADTWYTEAVAWAAGEGIVLGNGEGFAPNDNITREQIATILYRYMKYLGFDVSAKGDLNKFKDGKDVSSWAQDAMLWAEKVGLFKGDDNGNLNPRSNATRAEVATLLERLVKLVVM